MKSSSLSEKNHQMVVMIINRCYFYSTHVSLIPINEIATSSNQRTVGLLAIRLCHNPFCTPRKT
ncbi:MAG TPA: hypothetical protein GX009_05920 [Candidatus Atribacteria bacterium]|nr:hypothetical protein [Candidatus Atribacteria bacterium]